MCPLIMIRLRPRRGRSCRAPAGMRACSAGDSQPPVADTRRIVVLDPYHCSATISSERSIGATLRLLLARR